MSEIGGFSMKALAAFGLTRRANELPFSLGCGISSPGVSLFPVFSRSFPEEAFLCADLYCQAWLSLLL